MEEKNLTSVVDKCSVKMFSLFGKLVKLTFRYAGDPVRDDQEQPLEPVHHLQLPALDPGDIPRLKVSSAFNPVDVCIFLKNSSPSARRKALPNGATSACGF
jgi:hypothetical protein